MKNLSTTLARGAAILIGSWCAYSLFFYVSYTKKPSITLSGIEDNCGYRGTVSCGIQGNAGYKVKKCAVFLDGKKITHPDNEYIGARVFDRDFKIDTKNLEKGKHTLRLEACDASYNANALSIKRVFFVDNTPLKAVFLHDAYSVDQGRTIHVQLQANKSLENAEITFRSEKYRCYPESEHATVYECFIPVDCQDQPNEYLMTAELHDSVHNSLKLTNKVHVNYFSFKKARGDYSNITAKLDDEKSESKSDKDLKRELETVRKNASAEKLWTGSFSMPLDVKRVTTPFGELRTTPEKGRYHHAAVDLVGIPHAVIWASQRGKVVVKERFLFSGNTIVLDHGCGVTTLYYHLASFGGIEIGDVIDQGTPVGYQGKTGYALGEHLHFELRINNKQVDPLQWIKKDF